MNTASPNNPDQRMKVVLDTNCLIDAVKQDSPVYKACLRILYAWEAGIMELHVSRHSLAELSKQDETTDAARNLARRLTFLPHWPIGKWHEQVAAWCEVNGTWNDAKRNEAIQREITSLAKSGNDIRDRGAYIDALLSRAELFVTSDHQLAGNGPASRLQERFGLRIVTPEKLASELGCKVNG